jgi:hypothetical protein
MDYNVVPVACVDEHWLKRVFLPDAMLHLDRSVGLSLLPTDSPEEGDYLLGQIEKAFSGTRKVHRISLNHRDPTICLMSIWGSSDRCCFSQIEPQTILIGGGHYMPNWFIEEQLFSLDKLCSAFHKTLVMSVGRLENLRKIERSSIQTLGDVPAFTVYPQETKKNFIRWAATQYLDNIANDSLSGDNSIREQISELVIQKNPSSREQIVGFMLRLNERVTLGDEEDYLSAASSVAELHFASQPVRLFSCSELSNLFRDCCSRLEVLRAPFKTATDMEFFRENQEMPHAFDGGDPLNWLMSVVAYLSNLFIDAGKQRGLSIIDQFCFDHQRNDLIAFDGRSEFRDALHTLRTFFFHGMDPANKDNNSLLSNVAKLMAHSNPSSKDIRHTARYTLLRLLELLRDLVENAEKVVLALPMAPTAYMLKQRLEGVQREVEDYVLKRVFRETVGNLKLDLDPDLMFQIHCNGIKKKIATSTCSLANLHGTLIGIVEETCILEARRFPNIGELLLANGLKDRELGFARESLKQEWDSNPQMTLEQLTRKIPELSASIIASRQILPS